MSETNQVQHVLLGLHGDEIKKLDVTITSIVASIYPWMTAEQKESLHMMTRADLSASCLAGVMPPELEAVGQSISKLLFDYVARWARKGGTMTDKQWSEVTDALFRLRQEVNDHYVRRLTQQVN